MEFDHQPVLAKETIQALRLKPRGIYVDCTLGGGGHSLEMLKAQPDCRVIGIDRDPYALEAAKRRLTDFSANVEFVHGNFRNLDQILDTLNTEAVDGIVMDLGVSSPQLDQAERGFSYQQDARLDMRMDPTGQVSAYDLVNNLSKRELARIIKEYGEERWAARIAEFIVIHRQSRPIETTGELVSIIKAAVPKKARSEGAHPAKRTFQALRIAVNDELGALAEALEKAVERLRPGGRLCVITFHSLEDRIVKQYFSKLGSLCSCPPDFPVCSCGKRQMVTVITKKPITASDSELAANPRARSAKLRVCERLPEEDT
ncbi:MAG TPA: 16S rRNA (cytosine(1402)-N(4))-methyltransferase RsmH [Limnochordia bacterium]|nr:16S rRNA (cytosine(1402)-N(4))-methyltransferase RsmH [Limnochordia bacterium]